MYRTPNRNLTAGDTFIYETEVIRFVEWASPAGPLYRIARVEKGNGNVVLQKINQAGSVVVL